MRSLSLFALMLLFCMQFECFGQSEKKNRVKTFVAQKAGYQDLTNISDEKLVRETIQYMDGLGRPIQTISRWASPDGDDIVQPIFYDGFGRESKSFLPYTAEFNSGQYQPLDLSNENYINSEHFNFYNDPANKVVDDAYPFAQVVFENSPLNRVLQQGAPGAVWQPLDNADPNTLGKVVSMDYSINGSSDAVSNWAFRNGSIELNGVYLAGELIKMVTTDENGNQVHEFTDKRGRIVLKKAFLSQGTSADTYYVYGDDDLLYYVFPPELSDRVSGSSPTMNQLNDWAFQYKYDERLRMIEKRVPGAEWVYMVYDSRDRLVLTQDGNQRNDGQWVFTKYDVLNRPIATGFYANVASRDVVQSEMDNFYSSSPMHEERGTLMHEYTNQSFPTTPTAGDYLTVTYYDTYDFIDNSMLSEFSTDFGFIHKTGFSVTSGDQLKGQVTGMKTRVLGENSWIHSVNYYDERYRPIQTVVYNEFQDVLDRSLTAFKFNGEVLKTLAVHEKQGEASREILREYDLDHMGRLKSVDHTLDGGDTKTLVQNEYNEIGELTRKGLHEDNGQPVQSIDYKYNIRGWLTDINSSEDLQDQSASDDDYFGMGIAYEKDILVNSSGSTAAPPTKVLLANTLTDFSKVSQGDNGFKYGYYTSETTTGTFSTSQMSVIIHNWERNDTSPIIGRKYMHPRSGKPSVRRYTVGSNGEVAFSGTVLIEGKFYDWQTGGGNGANGFVTVDGIEKFSQKIIEGSSENSGYISFSLTVEVSEGSTIDFGILSLGNSSYDGRGMSATISVLHEPSIDQSYSSQFNGNISAIQWKTFADGQSKMYSYHYDGLNRITGADYSQGQMIGTSWDASSSQGEFSVKDITYDLNGNILTLNRQGKGTDIQTIDALDYSYHGNQLIAVTDIAAPGGFIDGNTTQQDYLYDKNGNMYQDLNKGIVDIEYNHLNLPSVVRKSETDYIEYFYNATGVKLRQVVHEDGETETTDYLGDYIYEDTQIASIQHEEGRILQNPQTGTWDYHYYIKDHLGNVRTTFTTNPGTWEFLLNYEGNLEDQTLFEEIDPIIENNSVDHTDTGSTFSKVQRLTGDEGSRVGGVLTLPVHKGDVISAQAFVKYEDPDGSTNVTTTVAMTLLGVLAGQSTAINEFGSQTINNSFTNSGSIIGTTGFQVDQNNVKGFLNLLFIDESGSPAVDGSRFAYDQIYGAEGNQNVGGPIVAHGELNIDDFVVPANGVIIVYVSNEQDEYTNMYFDDIKVTVDEHPIMQTDDYYPFGLAHSGGYQRATAKEDRFKFNGKERITDLGLNWDDFGARMYMPEIGRWGVVDPKAELFLSWSPYNFALNNPIRYEDIGGKGPGDRVKNAKKAVRTDMRKYKQVNGSAAYGDNYVDCSEFCREVALSDGYDPGRTSRDQAAYYKSNGEYTTDISEVEVGDFLFWKKKGEDRISHTGIAIAKDENGRFTIAQAGLQNGGKSINDKYKTSTDGALWKGTSLEREFVGAGKPEGESFLNDKISVVESNIARLQKKIKKREESGKSIGNLENRLSIQQFWLNIYLRKKQKDEEKQDEN